MSNAIILISLSAFLACYLLIDNMPDYYYMILSIAVAEVFVKLETGK